MTSLASPLPIPTLPAPPLVGAMPAMLRAPLDLMERAGALGGLVRLPLGPQSGVLVTDPAALKHILRDNHRNYPKGFSIRTIELLIGQSLPVSDGDFWLRQRRMMQPAFHRRHLDHWVSTMCATIAAARAGWPQCSQGQAWDLGAATTELTLQIVMAILFSNDVDKVSASVAKAVTDALAYLSVQLQPVRLPDAISPAYRDFRAALSTLDAFLFATIVRRRERPDPEGGDLLGLMLEARDADDGRGMTDKQLRDEVMTMFLAGHETAAVLLGWVWHLLAWHPEIQEQVRDEVDAVLQGGDPTPQMLDLLPQTRGVVQEALRLYPPTWLVTRVSAQPDVVAGYDLPGNTTLYISPYAVHRRAELWPEPGRFLPERFAAGRLAGRPEFAYMPFGGGPRKCIGDQFALIEATLIVALVLQRYTIRAVPGRPVLPRPKVTLRPSHGVVELRYRG